MVEADAERGGVVRVLRISHSATVAAWRGRERALRDLGVDVTLLAAREWNAGGAPVALAHGEEAIDGPVRTWGRHPALFVYDPIPFWRALGEHWDVVDIHEEPFALATAEVLLLRALRRQRAPYVLYTAQNLPKRYPMPFRWLERWALRHAAGISACNADAARHRRGEGIRRPRPGHPAGRRSRANSPPAGSDSARAPQSPTASRPGSWAGSSPRRASTCCWMPSPGHRGCARGSRAPVLSPDTRRRAASVASQTG